MYPVIVSSSGSSQVSVIVDMVELDRRFCGAAGGAAAGVMVIYTESVVLAAVSLTVKVNVMVVLAWTAGATKVVDSDVASARVMFSAESCVHRYDNISPSGSVALPARCTMEPSCMVCSGPALAVGGSLVSYTCISNIWWLFVPKPPADVTLTAYACLVGITSSTRLDPVMLKEAESPPVPIPYVVDWPSRNVFWADIWPTTPGASSFSMVVLSGTTYQAPRFWRNEEAPLNIQVMLVTCETFQDDMSPLKEEAPENMMVMSVTEATSHPDMLPLKARAPENMVDMSVTWETSQKRFWLKEEAPVNMLFMLVTEETSQCEILPLKEEAPVNMLFMLVTEETSQCEILPLKEEA